MSRTLLFAAGCAALLGAVSPANSQPPSGSGERDRSRGGFSSDPNERFNQLSGGKDVIVIDQLDERTKMFVNMMAQRAGITNGQITRDQYTKAIEGFRSQMGGFRGPGGPGGPPGGSPGGGGPPGLSRGEMKPEDVDRAAEESFSKHDRDKDGMLRVDEMSNTLRPIWTNYDKNKDGMIDLNEYKAYYRDRQQSRTQDSGQQPPQPAQPGQPQPAQPDGLPPSPGGPATPEEEDRRPVVFRVGKLPKELPAWFAELDTDKDGQVGLYEWVKGGRSVEDFKSMDRNDDGLLTIEEVLGYVRNGNKQPGTDTTLASAGGDDRSRSSRFGSDSRGGPPGTRSMGDSRSGFDRSRFGGDSGRGGPPSGRPDFGRSRDGGGTPGGDTRSRGETPGGDRGYSGKSRFGRGPDRGGSDATTPPDAGRSDSPSDGGKEKKKDKSKKDRS